MGTALPVWVQAALNSEPEILFQQWLLVASVIFSPMAVASACLLVFCRAAFVLKPCSANCSCSLGCAFLPSAGGVTGS